MFTSKRLMAITGRFDWLIQHSVLNIDRFYIQAEMAVGTIYNH